MRVVPSLIVSLHTELPNVVLTKTWSWRATFYFLSALASILFAAFLLFKDTFRKERSLAYQAALARMKSRELVAKRNASQSQMSKKLRDTWPISHADSSDQSPDLKVVKLSLADVNPFPQISLILKRKNNLAIYFPSCESSASSRCRSHCFVKALVFALSYSISYTCSTTLFAPPYNYDALRVGLVLLLFGIGMSFCKF